MPRRTPIETASMVIAATLVGVGLLSWAGWALQIRVLIQPFGSLPPAKVNEAFCWLFLGLALLGIELRIQRASLLVVPPAFIAGLTLAEHFFHVNVHIDELLARDTLLIDTAHAGRMAVASAASILLSSLTLLWRLIPRGQRARLFAEAVCGSIVFSVGFSTLMGYAVSLPAVYRWGTETATGAVSAIALLLVGTALLANAWRASYRSEGGPPVWSPMPPVIACLTMTVILWIGMREREYLYLSNNTQNALNTMTSLVDLEMKQIGNDVEEHLAAPWNGSGRQMSASWEADAASFLELRQDFGCVAVLWVDPQGRTQWVFPTKGNEGMVGFNALVDEASANAIRTARARGRPAFSQTLSLPLHGQGFAIYAPVLNHGKLEGFVSAEFTYDGFFGAIDRRRKFSADYDLLIVINGSPVYGNLKFDDIASNPYALEQAVSIQDRRVRFAISPNEAYLQQQRRFLPELTLLSGLGITLLLGLSVHFARSARAGMLSSEQSNRRLLAENEERRRIEERLKTSDERLRLALDSTGVGIFEWNVASGYVYYSTGLWIMLGYEPNRMAATPDSLQSLIHPEDLPNYRRRVEAQLAGASPFIDPEFRIRSRSGEWRWVNIRAKSVATLPSGAPIRILGTLQDVTARREAEEALRASQAATRKLSLVAARTDNLVIIFSPDGRVDWVNESFTRLTEYALTDIGGKRPAEFLSGADTDPRSIGRIRNAIAQGQPISTDIVQYSRSGRKFHLSYDIQPVRNKSAEIENFIAVASDITARVETEQALRRAKSEADAASRAKSEFLASMSHEIRTPMNGVIGMTALLLETNLNQEQREFVNTIRHSGEALLTIINDILDFSKIESGKMELERMPFELGICIEEAIEVFAVQAASKRLELAYYVDRDVPPTVLGDVMRLRQVLVNLVNNAIKFTSKGSISVEVRRAPGDPVELGVPPGRILLEFSVRDSGIGIPSDRVNRLFKVFSQVDSSTTRKYGGTGLGLAICERLCSLMGGSIRVESTEGRGSSFIFTIQTESAPNSQAENLPPLPPALQNGGLLVIEDHPVAQRRLLSLLDAWGITPAATSDPAQAPVLAKSMPQPPSLIMVDYDLTKPDSCFEKLADIRAPRLVMLPFGYAPPDTPSDGNHYAFIAKPIRSGSLYQTIVNIFANSAAAASGAAQAPHEPLLGETIPLNVLLVEDNPVNQKVALRFLERLGYLAQSANNGLEAVAAVEQHHFDLVLMDLQMPEMDGLEASRQIRQHLLPDRQPKIIALTANALHGDRELCLAAGMDDYITKPVKLAEIAEAIRRHFGAART